MSRLYLDMARKPGIGLRFDLERHTYKSQLGDRCYAKSRGGTFAGGLWSLARRCTASLRRSGISGVTSWAVPLSRLWELTMFATIDEVVVAGNQKDRREPGGKVDFL